MVDVSAGGVCHMRDIPERFRSKFKKAAGGCWLWTARLNHKGYAVFWDIERRQPVGAHRWLWELLYGAVPPRRSESAGSDRPRERASASASGCDKNSTTKPAAPLMGRRGR